MLETTSDDEDHDTRSVQRSEHEKRCERQGKAYLFTLVFLFAVWTSGGRLEQTIREQSDFVMSCRCVAQSDGGLESWQC